VFATSIGTPLDGGEVLRALHRLLAAAGIPKLRFHDLRHAYATLSLGAGEDLATIRDALGHSSIAITADTYAHVLDRTRGAAADRLEAFVSGSQAG